MKMIAQTPKSVHSLFLLCIFFYRYVVLLLHCGTGDSGDSFGRPCDSFGRPCDYMHNAKQEKKL